MLGWREGDVNFELFATTAAECLGCGDRLRWYHPCLNMGTTTYLNPTRQVQDRADHQWCLDDIIDMELKEANEDIAKLKRIDDDQKETVGERMSPFTGEKPCREFSIIRNLKA